MVDNPETIADGARTPYLGRVTFPLVVRHVDDIVTVADEVYMLYPEDSYNLKRVQDRPAAIASDPPIAPLPSRQTKPARGDRIWRASIGR